MNPTEYKFTQKPPYDFMMNYLFGWKRMFDSKNPEYKELLYKEFGNKLDTYNKFNTLFLFNMSHPELKVIILDDDLKELFENTDNNIFERKLFYNRMFIDYEIHKGNCTIKGLHIMFEDVDVLSIAGVILYDTNILRETYLETPFVWNLHYESHFSDGFTEDMKKEMLELEYYVKIIVCNMLDFVENTPEDIEVITVETTKEQNNKRKMRGKIPIPNKIYIRPTSDKRIYYRKLNDELFQARYSHKFIVRGHWRHLRSERYGEHKGLSTWIKPYIKGEGVLINKKSIIKGDKNG